MKRLLPIVLFISVGLSQHLTEVIETYEYGNVKSITYHKKTRTGIEKVKYEGYHFLGHKEEERIYNNGGRDILRTEWYDNGNKKQERTYKNGKKDGLQTEWYWNGQKSYEVTWKDGKQDGLTTKWYYNGQKEYERTYKDGKLDGSPKRWNQDGSVKE